MVILSLNSTQERELLRVIRHMIDQDDDLERGGIDTTGSPVPTLYLKTSWVELYREWKGIPPELSELIELRSILEGLSRQTLQFVEQGFDAVPLLQLFSLSSDPEGQLVAGLELRLSGYVDFIENDS